MQNKEDFRTHKWRKLRTQIINRSNGICEVCGRTEARHVHHKTYRYGVLCDPVWLLAVCRNCHDEIHKQQGDGKYGKGGKRLGNPKGNRGGARIGAGRKATGHKRKLDTFSIEIEILKRLKASIPRNKRSKFVSDAISEKLDRFLK